MNVLGIETSCDETAAAVIADGRLVRSNVVASQITLHARYGGVVPEVASRQHMVTILPVIEQAIGEAGIEWRDIDGVAVTNGPGLAGALLVGVNVAKTIAFARGLPLLGVNHLEGHIYANWLVEPSDLPPDGRLPPPPAFPLLCLIVSGGHTDLLLMADHGDYRRIGSTLDDAAGEAFDKVARLLGLAYPGGPAIQHAAVAGNPSAFRLPRAWLRGTLDFSFSGLKTAVLHTVRDVRAEQGLGQAEPLPAPVVADLAASFQAAVVDVLVAKTVNAAKAHGVVQVIVAGGVAANGALRAAIEAASPLPVAYPKLAYCTDNAAMIAAAGGFHLRRGRIDGWDLDVHANWELAAK